MKISRRVIIMVMMLSSTSPLFSEWIIQHSGLPSSPNPTLIFSAVDSNVCWGIQFEIANPKCVLTTDGGNHWTLIDLPFAQGLIGISIAALTKDIAWITLDDSAGTANGGIFKTTNGGADWVKQESAFPGSGGHPRNICFFDANSGLCIGEQRNGYWEIYTTTNGGLTWTRVPATSIPVAESGEFTRGQAAKSPDNGFWFGSAFCSIYMTADRGITWSARRMVFPLPAYGIEIAFKDKLNGLASSYFGDEINKLSRSTDGGMSWTAQHLLPSNPSFHYLSSVPSTSGTYFMVAHKNIGYPEPTSPGSAYTEDDGMTWKQVDNLEHGMATFVDNKTGWSAGCGDTIFKWSGPPLGLNDHNLNTGVKLFQNYPNPFTTSTTIQFNIPVSSRVTLKVYDIRGLEVRTLVEAEKPAGTCRVVFEPRESSSGIYYCRLRVGDDVQVKKLIVLSGDR